MDLIERYIREVKAYLPGKQQTDIGQELNGNLHAAVDDREEELGRPLTESEVERLLQGFGHPLVVAGRYQASQGSLAFGPRLIGPVLFPLYLRVLWLLIGIGSLLHALILVALGVTGTTMTAGDIANTFVLQIVIQFAVVTGGFIVVERTLPMMRWTAQPGRVGYPGVFDSGRSLGRVRSSRWRAGCDAGRHQPVGVL
ncbi:MAG TPA: hypothetical protein VMV29_10110 [Ktedonobacterales bacterium]|nr:hypothetical protein [Ktedonobacterales bacterium]